MTTARTKMAAVAAALALEAHRREYGCRLLAEGTHAGSEFDRLYLIWITARWDDGDVWVRSVWPSRPLNPTPLQRSTKDGA